MPLLRRALATTHIMGLFDMQLAFFILAQHGCIFDLDQAFSTGLLEFLEGTFGSFFILKSGNNYLYGYITHLKISFLVCD